MTSPEIGLPEGWHLAICIFLIISTIEKEWFQTPWKNVPDPLEKPEAWHQSFCNCLIHNSLQNKRCQPCKKNRETRPKHCTNPESKHLSERSDFACRRTAASAAESPPRGRGLRPAVFPFYSPRKSEQVRFLSARAKG